MAAQHSRCYVQSCFGPLLFQSHQRGSVFKCVFICVNLWSVISSLPFQMTVDFMTQWNGGSKRALSVPCWTFCSAWVWNVTQSIIRLSSAIKEPQTCFSISCSQISEVTSSIFLLRFPLIRLGCWSHASVYSFTGASLKSELSLRRIVCFDSTLTAGGGEAAVGLSPLTLMERHRFYGARLYWPVADIYFLVS